MDRRYDYVGADRSKLLFDSPYVDQASVIQGNYGGGEDYSLEGFLGRIAYDYNNKYFINLVLEEMVLLDLLLM
ncbi:hypothetical protein [Flavobacterium sp.]|uniref:hypothetical protein n=1 Tax=Flavobacterium sp. TaxID=239 RepID=UPI0035271809